MKSFSRMLKSDELIQEQRLVVSSNAANGDHRCGLDGS